MTEDTLTSPAMLADVMSTPEFNALPFEERKQVVERGLSESAQWLQQERGGWTPQTWQEFGDTANAVRQSVTEGETFLEKTGAVLKQAGGAVKDALLITGTQAVGLSPVLPTPEGGITYQVPGETLVPMMMNRSAALTGGLAGTLLNDEAPMRGAIATVKQGLDTGAFFGAKGGLNEYLDLADEALQQAAAQYHGFKEQTQQNSVLQDPENVKLMAAYLASRNPETWTALEKRLMRTPFDVMVQADRQRLQTETKLGQALKPEVQPMIGEAADPAEAAGNLVGVGMGANVLRRGVSAGQRVRQIGTGLGAEMLSEQISATMEDPRLSLAERAQVAKDSIISAAGLMGAGALPVAAVRAVDAMRGTTPALGQPVSQTGQPVSQTGQPMSQPSPLAGIAARGGRVDVPPLLPEDTGDFTAAEARALAPRQPILTNVPDRAPDNAAVSTPPPADQTVPDAVPTAPPTITGSNVQTGTEMPVPPPTAAAGAGAGGISTPASPTPSTPPTPAAPAPAATPETGGVAESSAAVSPSAPLTAAPAAVQPGELVTYEGYAGRLTQDGQRLTVETPEGTLVDVADPAGLTRLTDPAVRQRVTLGEMQRSARGVTVSEATFTPAPQGTTPALQDARGRTYVPHNPRLLRSVRQGPNGLEVLVRDTAEPGRIIKLVGPQALQAQDALIAAAAQVEAAGGKVNWGTQRPPGFRNLDTSGRTAGFLNTEILAEGAALIRRGVTDFASWSRAMVQRFGAAIREFLAGIWQQITSPQTTAAQNVRLGMPQGTAPVTVGEGGFVGTGSPGAEGANLTQARFAPPNEVDQTISGRADADVLSEAQAWLAGRSAVDAVAALEAGSVTLAGDAKQRAMSVLINRLSQTMMQGDEAQQTVTRTLLERMSRLWVAESNSADVARELRQRAVANNADLAPVAPILATLQILVDRGKKVLSTRFTGGEGALARTIQAIGAAAGRAAGTSALADKRLQQMLDALRKKIAPGMTWTEIFTDMPEAQKTRQREIYRRLMLDERLAGLTLDERVALTNELDKAWQRERRKVFQRELQKAGVLGEKKASDRQKVVNGLPKLLRLMNLGVLSADTVREVIAAEYGLRSLSAADVKRLRDMGNAAYQLPEGSRRNRALKAMMQEMQALTGATWTELLSNYWTASVLSGLRTQFDTFLSVLNGLGANLMQAGTLLARGQGRSAVEAHAQWWRYLASGALESMQILAKGDTTYLKQFGDAMQEALKGERISPIPAGEMLWRNGNVWQKYFMAPVMIFTGRLMAAADHLNNTATTGGALAVARALNPELYAGRAGFTAAERAAARTQAILEVTGGTPPATMEERAQVSIRTRELLSATVEAQDVQAASEIGDIAAFQNDPTGVFGSIYSAVKQGLGSAQRKLGAVAEDEAVNRHTRALSLVLASTLHGITGTRFMRFGFNFGADITRYIPGTYLLGKAGFYGRNVSRMQQDLLLGKNLVGLMLGSTLAAMFLSKDDEEDGWHIEGDWSTLTPQEQKQRMSAGLERMTMWKRENGQVSRVSYKQWPTMGLFAMVGRMLDEKRHKPDIWAQRGTAGHLGAAALTGMFQIQNVSAMQNLAQLFGQPTFAADPAAEWGERITKMFVNYPGGLVPTLVKDADIWADPRSYKPEGMMELMARNIPIARRFVNDGRPQLNQLGEEVKLQRAPWSRAYTTVESGDAHRVLGGLLARGLNLPAASDKAMITKDGVRMPIEALGGEAVWRYEKAVGEGYRAWLASPDGQALLTMPVQQAERVINYRAESIKRQAKAKVTRY